MPIELGPTGAGPTRAAGALDARIVRQGGGAAQGPGKPAPAEPEVVRSDARDPGAPPIDAERVHTIRRAIETGTYPVLPTRIADAIIAAGILLRSGK